MRKVLLVTGAMLMIFAIGVTAAPKEIIRPSITLDVPLTATVAESWEPVLGDWVSFTVTFAKQVERYGPRVQLICYQGTTLVYGEAGPYEQSFLLGGGSSIWRTVGGSANCVADLYYWSYTGGQQQFNWLASTQFTAAAR